MYNRDVFYLNRDNTIDLILMADRQIVDLSPVTKAEVMDIGCSWAVNSVDTPSAFEIGGADGKLTLKFGQEPILPGSYSCYVIVYDPANPNGVVWSTINIVVDKTCPVS